MCRDSLIGLPLCSVSSRATSSTRSISRAASRAISRPRSRADIWPHGPDSAARAAATAASTSAAPAAATSVMTSSVAGLTTAMAPPEAASRHSLLIRSCFIWSQPRGFAPRTPRLASASATATARPRRSAFGAKAGARGGPEPRFARAFMRWLLACPTSGNHQSAIINLQSSVCQSSIFSLQSAIPTAPSARTRSLSASG